MVDFWVETRLVSGSSRVLDIGCGPGTYALPLANVAKEVTALDTSRRMLEHLTAEAGKRGLRNIISEQGNWENMYYDKEFDLVLAAHSPAIHNYDTLMMMNGASRGFCLLLCYARGYCTPLRLLLWQEVMGEELKNEVMDISFPFNILYAEGFNLYQDPHIYSLLFLYPAQGHRQHHHQRQCTTQGLTSSVISLAQA